MDVGMEAIETRAFALAEQFRVSLADIPGATLRDLGHETGVDRCAIVSFTVDGLEPAKTVATLRTKGIAIGGSSKEGALLDATARGLPLLMRAAPHYYNTEDEIELLVRELKMLARR
jgi:selenocysteine lyase/cysteine desulfurase